MLGAQSIEINRAAVNTNPFKNILLRIDESRKRLRLRAILVTIGWVLFSWLFIILLGVLVSSLRPEATWLWWTIGLFLGLSGAYVVSILD